ncbi:MAG TPA: PxKF domain-containing protein [Candidatus Acidoferrum sp.]|nr:PxKF domain-containing protein [Candidatus Acidoferrum sp.]
MMKIKTIHPTLGAILGSGLLKRVAAGIGMLLVSVFAQTGSAQTQLPLALSNNYMVTGDYVVGGWTKTSSTTINGTQMSTGNIPIPDATAYGSVNLEQQVPVGADIVAAFLYWETVETSGTFTGQNGYFRNYPITGTVLGNPNAPVSWSSGGCAGSSQGSKTIVGYRADVSSYIPADAAGNIQPNTSYQVSLPDTGKAGQPPYTMGATLVIVYRLLSPNVPLSAVIIYDGAFAPSNSSQITNQPIVGIYQAGNDQAAPIATKITHIVANGQSNKLQQVFLNNYNAAGTLVHSTLLPSLYGSNPPFPGKYNTAWDNPTWFPNSYPSNFPNTTTLAVQAGESSESTVVVPNGSNKGCVTWGAVVMSTTVQDSDHDGLLDTWKTNQGYCDAGSNRGMSNQGACRVADVTDPAWVALPGAHAPGQGNQDIFVQLDYMCSKVISNADGTTTCDTTNGVSYRPSAATLNNVTSAFGTGHNISLHIIPDDNNVILAQPCTDNFSVSPAVYCPYPSQAGVVGWEAGFAFLKTQPLNYPDEVSCETRTPQGGAAGSGPACVRRWQPGKNNSYHEVIFGVGAATPSWGFLDGSLSSISAAGTTVTITTSSAHGLVAASSTTDTNPNARVTISDAISNPNLNGTFLVQTAGIPNQNTFTIQIANAATASYTQITDPFLAIGTGVASTRSGISDIGGADSLITLGLWGPDGQTDQVQSGTLMHELGHSLGLTHGGLSRTPVAGGYVFNFEPNCKSNHLSVMNYMFQVDLLDGNLDYSEQVLNSLNESLASPPNILSNVNQTTKWYAPNQPFGSPATSHCDGSPITPNDPSKNMFRLEGPASSISWSAKQDINFDGQIEASLDGFNDWASLDLRQIGATGNDFWAAGGVLSSKTGGGVLSSKTGGGVLSSKTGGGVLSSKTGGGVLSSKTGGGVGSEINTQIANSVVRPPKITSGPSLTAANFIQFQFTAPGFGQSQIASFNVYRIVNTAAPVLYANVPVAAGTALPLPTFTYTDQKVSCGASYSYFVTTLLTDGRGSVPSNTAGPISVPCTFVGFLSPLSTAGTINAPTFSGTVNQGSAVPLKWQILDGNGNLISDLSTLKLIQACPTTGNTVPPASSSVPPCVLLYSPTTGAKGNSTFRFSSPLFVFNWDTKSTIGSVAGWFTVELTLNDGSPVKATTIRFQ